MRLTIGWLIVALALGSPAPPLFAQDMTGPAAGVAGASSFSGYVLSLRPLALAEGVRPTTFDSVAPTLSFDPRVISSDRAQPGGTGTGTGPIEPFAPYRRAHVDADRIDRGRSRFRELQPLLVGLQTQTGVTPAVAMAIWGHETDYGGFSGRYDLLTSLASLAYEGRRRALFAEEFIAALKLLDRGIPRQTLRGSWAGATGGPQFLPSMVLRLGRDGDGDGRVDIWNSAPDTLASIANYLVNAGWKAGVPWGVAVSVPARLDRAALQTRLISPRCPRVLARHSRWLTVAEWKRLGIVAAAARAGAWPRDDEMATLLEPDGPGATAYLLTSNYRVILDYNCSNFYALSVGLLADAISG